MQHIILLRVSTANILGWSGFDRLPWDNDKWFFGQYFQWHCSRSQYYCQRSQTKYWNSWKQPYIACSELFARNWLKKAVNRFLVYGGVFNRYKGIVHCHYENENGFRTYLNYFFKCDPLTYQIIDSAKKHLPLTSEIGEHFSILNKERFLYCKLIA